MSDLNVQIWIHQSNLLWSRLQTISAIQVGAFTGWYFLRGKDLWLANSLLILTILLLILFVPIFYRDIYYLKKFRIEDEKKKTGVKRFIRGRYAPYALLIILGISNLLLLFLAPQSQESKPLHNTATPNQQIQDQQDSSPKIQEPRPIQREPAQPTAPE